MAAYITIYALLLGLVIASATVCLVCDICTFLKLLHDLPLVHVQQNFCNLFYWS